MDDGGGLFEFIKTNIVTPTLKVHIGWEFFICVSVSI